MTHEFISPNLHVVLIHYPLGLLIAGTLIELFSFLWSRSGFRTAGRWMILLGALSAVPATFSGIYALNSIAQANNPAGEAPWVDVKSTSPTLSDPVVFAMLRKHVLYQSIATGLCVLAVVVWLGGSDRARRSLHIPLLAVLLLGVATIIYGSYFGGEAIYRHGVGVEPDKGGAKPPPELVPNPARSRWEQQFPPVELHVITAGTVVAIALAAIGLSFRKLTASYDMQDDRRPIRPRDETMAPNGGGGGGPGPRTPPSNVSMVRSFNPEIEVTVNPFAPASRFWLLTFLLGLMAIGGGLYVSHADELKSRQNVFRAVWSEIKPAPDQKINRLLGHVVAGTVITITPLVLAGLARFAPRRRFWLSFFTLVLIFAVASQIWFGVLLLYDTPEGPTTKFRTSEATAPAVTPSTQSAVQ
jgi:uncharacterized membrane protein